MLIPEKEAKNCKCATWETIFPVSTRLKDEYTTQVMLYRGIISIKKFENFCHSKIQIASSNVSMEKSNATFLVFLAQLGFLRSYSLANQNKLKNQIKIIFPNRLKIIFHKIILFLISSIANRNIFMWKNFVFVDFPSRR